MRQSPLLFVASLLVAGCHPWKYTVPNEPSGPGPSGQTYQQAVKVMCDVDTLAEIAPEEPEELADTTRFTYLESAVDNPDGIYLRTLLSVSFGEDRACLLREAQETVGLPKCALAESTN